MSELGSLGRWLSPEVQSIGRRPMTAPLAPYDDVASARRGEPSPWVRSLDGAWSFTLCSHPDEVTEAQLTGPADTWPSVAVPGSWVRQGHGDPAYLNLEMPFDLHAPEVPEHNPTAIYRRSFRLPDAWTPRRTVLRIGSADSLAWVWCNGAFVGMGKDSRLASDFDVTPLLRPGVNELAVVVPQWSDASWIEDQDQWWLPGLHRSVKLVSLPVVAIADAALVPGLHADLCTGTLQVDVTVDAPRDQDDLTVEVIVEGPRRRVMARLAPTAVPVFEDRHGAFSAYLWPGARVRADLVVAEVEPWSHEHPIRYGALVVLRSGAEVIDVRTTKVGFRSVEVTGGRLLINGAPVVVNGVNRHENHPDTGRVVSVEDMRRDLELMKQHHVNAVRTAHYPCGEAFYDLCDELGLYVVDEANVESHGRWAQLAQDPAWIGAFVERGVRMVLRDRSHPCVIIWSLGNESGDGPGHDAMAGAIRRLDPSRPVQYEGPFFGNIDAPAPVSDIVCPMYETPEAIAAWSERADDAHRPLILCEYAHAMGQAGGLDAYWDLFGRRRGLQGGFVWEWADHGLRRTEPDGTTWLAYGGDFGEPRHDGTFVCDGLVSPDRDLHPLLTELAALTAPVGITREGTNLRIENRRWFTDTSDLHTTWTWSVDGQDRSSGSLDVGAIAPRTGVTVAAPSPPEVGPGREVHLSVRCIPWKRPVFAGPRWVTAEAQFPWTGPPERHAVDRATTGRPPAPSVRRPADGPQPVVDTDGLVIGDRRIAWPQVSVWRAPTDNDDPPGAWRGGQTAAAGWRRAGLDALEVVDRTWTQKRLRTTRGTTWADPGGQVAVEHLQVVIPLGTSLRIDERISVTGDVDDLPRVGIRFQLSVAAARLDWLGLGPGDSYPDRRAAGSIRRWRTAVADQHLPFMVPQSYGLHLDTRWFALGTAPSAPATRSRRSPAPDGVLVWADAPFAFSALPHSVEALSEATHAHHLTADGATHVHLDIAHRGLGSAACGPEPQDQHRIGPGTFRFRWYLAAVPADRDPVEIIDATPT